MVQYKEGKDQVKIDWSDQYKEGKDQARIEADQCKWKYKYK